MQQFGHINFDQIHISALINSGNNVHVIMPERVRNSMSLEENMYRLIIPEWLSKERKSPIITRFFLILTLLYIKVKVNFSRYDLTLISNTDVISLGIAPLCKHMGLICHANAYDFQFKIKKYFLKRLSKDNFFIVFNTHMKKHFTENGIKNVFSVSHGCIAPFSSDNKTLLPFTKCEYNTIIFHPSSKCDESFVLSLHKDKDFEEMLKKDKILLILRGRKIIPDSHNIITISEKLSQELYQGIFLSSDIILLAYPETFKYQVSGISYECISNQKRMLIWYNQSLKYCQDFFNYDPMFLDTEELSTKIRMLENKETYKYVVTGDNMTPNYKQILEYIDKTNNPTTNHV